MINHCKCFDCERAHKRKKIKKLFWDVNNASTMAASSVMRQLAFGEAAILGYLGFPYNITPSTAWAIFLIVLYFISDISQYLVNAYSHRKKTQEYEARINKTHTGDIVKDRKMLTPSYFCFHAKIIFLLAASLILILFKLFPFIVCGTI